MMRLHGYHRMRVAKRRLPFLSLRVRLMQRRFALRYGRRHRPAGARG
jgi:hypothetical protein